MGRWSGRFRCTVCGKRGADVTPDFHWKRTLTGMRSRRSMPSFVRLTSTASLRFLFEHKAEAEIQGRT
jgi:hypothetical protein